MPSTSRCGVDKALPKVSAPERSSNTAISVKVPPMSAARRMWGRDFARIACFIGQNSIAPQRHGRACPGHLRLYASTKQDVDARAGKFMQPVQAWLQARA